MNLSRAFHLLAALTLMLAGSGCAQAVGDELQAARSLGERQQDEPGQLRSDGDRQAEVAGAVGSESAPDSNTGTDTTTDTDATTDTTAPESNTGTDTPSDTTASDTTVGDWPGPDNTGVPRGMELEPSGTVRVTEDGTVVEGLEISGSVIVSANDVTVRNTRIRAGSHYPIDVDSGTSGTVIEDVEIDGQGRAGIGICCSNYVVRRANIHDTFDGVRLGSNTTIVDSYIHDLVVKSGTHNDGVQSTGGSNITVRGNHIHNPNSQTSAILIAPSLGKVADVTIDRNLLRGGGYTLYFFDRSGSVTRNRFDRSHRYGPVHSDTYAQTWQDNRYLDGADVRCPSC